MTWRVELSPGQRVWFGDASTRAWLSDPLTAVILREPITRAYWLEWGRVIQGSCAPPVVLEYMDPQPTCRWPDR